MNKAQGIVQAKDEYTKELINLLNDPICTTYLTMYENTRASTKNKREIIVNFQKSLQEVPLWNQALIDEKVKIVKQQCEFIADLIAAVFVTNVKILSSIKIKKDKQKIQITMPKCDQFIHKIFIACARTLYNNAYIFSVSYDSQKRKADMHDLVNKSIEDTIRSLLPFRNILENYLPNATNNESESEESDEEQSEPPETDESRDQDEPEPDEHEPEPDEPELDEPELDEPVESSEYVNDSNETEFNKLRENDTSVPPSMGFFSRPQQEEKVVPLQNIPPQMKMQSQPVSPVLFPDAAEDP